MMHPFKIALFIGVALLGLQADVRAQLPKQDIPAPARGYDWREPAKKRLDAKEIEQLAKDKILVTNEALSRSLRRTSPRTCRCSSRPTRC